MLFNSHHDVNRRPDRSAAPSATGLRGVARARQALPATHRAKVPRLDALPPPPLTPPTDCFAAPAVGVILERSGRTPQRSRSPGSNPLLSFRFGGVSLLHCLLAPSRRSLAHSQVVPRSGRTIRGAEIDLRVVVPRPAAQDTARWRRRTCVHPRPPRGNRRVDEN